MQNDYLERIERSEMTFYREVYKNSKRWTGEDLTGKTLLVYCEQGFGDIIQFARYFDIENVNVILHCPKPLHRLFSKWQVIDKEDSNLPPHDYHVLSMSLPFILKEKQPKVPYINIPPYPLEGLDNIKKIGICWEGNPDHPKNMERSCPLRFFKALCKPNRNIFMLQKEVQNKDLIHGCDDFNIYGTRIYDMYDLASLISAMDVIISVDTAVLHLAGAMGKVTFGLLAKDYDYRWKVRNWYPNMALLFQHKANNWIPVFAGLMMLLDTVLEAKHTKDPAEIVKIISESFKNSD